MPPPVNYLHLTIFSPALFHSFVRYQAETLRERISGRSDRQADADQADPEAPPPSYEESMGFRPLPAPRISTSTAMTDIAERVARRLTMFEQSELAPLLRDLEARLDRAELRISVTASDVFKLTARLVALDQKFKKMDKLTLNLLWLCSIMLIIIVAVFFIALFKP